MRYRVLFFQPGAMVRDAEFARVLSDYFEKGDCRVMMEMSEAAAAIDAVAADKDEVMRRFIQKAVDMAANKAGQEKAAANKAAARIAEKNGETS